MVIHKHFTCCIYIICLSDRMFLKMSMHPTHVLMYSIVRTLYVSVTHTHLCVHTNTTHTHTHILTHTTHTHTLNRRTLEKEAAAVVKTTGEPTRHANSSSNSSNGSSCSSSAVAPPTENGSLRSMRSLCEASSSSSATSSTTETRTPHPQQRVGRSEGTAVATTAAAGVMVGSRSHSQLSPPTSVDIKGLINQVGKDVRRTDKNHPYYKGENNINTKTLM